MLVNVFYDGVNDPVEVNKLPGAARRLRGSNKGAWVMGIDNPRCPAKLRRACGYVKAEVDEKPTLKRNQYLERNLVIRYDKPVIEWKRRIKTLDMQMQETANAVAKADMEELVRAKSELDKFLNADSPSLSDMRQHMKFMTRLMRVVLNDPSEDANA